MLGRTARLFVMLVTVLVTAISLRLTNKNALSPSLVKKSTPQKDIPTLIPHYNNITFVQDDIPVDPNAVYGNLDDIVKRKKLIVCALKRDNKPFFQIKGKDGYIGEDIRFASALGKALGVEVMYKMLYKTRNDVIDAIHNGEGDIGIAEISYTPERARKVTYSTLYIPSRKVVLINRAATISEDSDTLDGALNNPNAKIAVMKNTSYENYAEMLFPKAQILREHEWENGAIKKLQEGKVVAVIWDELRIKPLISAHPDLLLKFMPVIIKGENDPISAVTNINGYSLNLFINKFLENNYKVLTEKEILEIYKDYIK